MAKLDELRIALNKVDNEILQLIQRRQALSVKIGREKQASGRPTRDWQREREVLDRIGEKADSLGLPAGLAQRIIRTIIHASLQVQEHDQVIANAAGDGRSCLIIGGCGQMGQWFARFLSSQGYEVEIADISGPVPGYAFRSDWQSPVPKHDLIVVATSLAMTAEVLDKLEQINPTGVVMEIASLKTPHRDSLNRLARAGIRTASIHPMFGPSTTMLSGRHVICIDLGEHSAHGNGAELFSSTMANCVTMTLDEHDKLMATVLGMSHALNIAFFTALERSGSAIPELDRISSTTFDAQLKVSTAVSEESPNLYFEIQSLNTYGLEALEHLETAIRDVRLAIENTDRETFTALMERGREYLNARSASNRT